MLNLSITQRTAGGTESRSLVLQTASSQLHFNWAEEAAAGSNASDCIEPHRDSNNLVYQKPYATNIPAYRRIIPKGDL